MEIVEEPSDAYDGYGGKGAREGSVGTGGMNTKLTAAKSPPRQGRIC